MELDGFTLLYFYDVDFTVETITNKVLNEIVLHVRAKVILTWN